MKQVKHWIISFLTAVAVFSVSPVSAQETGAANGTVFDDWTLVCRAEAVNRTACGLVQRVSAGEQNLFVAEIGLNRVDVDGEARVLMVLQTPSAMLLPARPAYQVVGTETVNALEWRTCSGDFCSATRLLTTEEVAALRGGESMVLGYHPVNSAEPINFPGSLAGVTAGLRALDLE